MRSFLRQHPLPAFFLLAYILSWYPWVIALMRGQTTGPNPLGPFVAGIIMTAVVAGRAGLREFFSRIVRWRVGARWYAVVLFLPLAFCLIAVAVALCLPGEPVSFPTAEKLRELPDRFLFIFLFIGLGEEPGWRGYAVPQLQAKYSPLRASLILAPLWALWHLPLMGNEFSWPRVPAFLLSVFGATLLLTWLFNHTRGSVLLAMIFHAVTNSVGAGLIFPLFFGQRLIVLWWVYGAVCLCAGLGVMLFSAKQKVQPVSARMIPATG